MLITVDNDILLRTWEETDAPALFEAVQHSRAHLTPWLAWVFDTTREEHSLNYIKSMMQMLENQEGLTMGVFFDGAIIGEISMHHWDHKLKSAQLGYWISKDFVRRGIAVKCLKVLMRYLFEKTEITKLEIHFSAKNTQSAKVAAKLGTRVEGVIRNGVIRNGIIEDLVITGILKQEWQK